MTHTLHRILELTEDDFNNDIVVMMMAAKGFNKDNSADKKRSFLESVIKFDPVNYGEGVRLFLPDTLKGKDQKFFKNILTSINDDSTPVAVFNESTKVAFLLKDLKKKDLGLSVIVSGKVSLVYELLNDTEISLKSYALEQRIFKSEDRIGVYGNYYLLPSLKELEIQSMCGHGMIPYSLIQRVSFDLKLGRINIEEAARILERPCSCGIFNREKAKEILRQT